MEMASRRLPFLGLALAGVLGALLGAGAAWWRTGAVDSEAGRGPGPWRTQAGTGDAGASPLQRATIARTGIWALPTSEVVYFVAQRDDEGRPLDPACTYAVEGPATLPTRWWSIGAYRDYFWIDNPDDRYSFSSSSVRVEDDGSYRILVGPGRKNGNWLPSGDRPGRLTLLFRLYQPEPEVAADPEKVALPAIRRLGCPA